jgi:hypothetical protein
VSVLKDVPVAWMMQSLAHILIYLVIRFALPVVVIVMLLLLVVKFNALLLQLRQKPMQHTTLEQLMTVPK